MKKSHPIMQEVTSTMDRPIADEHSASDIMLVECAQSGDVRAFELLIKKYQSRVIALLYRFVKNEQDALDLAQDVFIKAYRALSGFRKDSAFYTWLYRIAVNVAKNDLAAKKRRPQSCISVEDGLSSDDFESLADLATPENKIIELQLQQKLREAIQSLPHDLRQAFCLREFEGFDYEKIASIMGCPIGTVRSRIFRAREQVDFYLTPFDVKTRG
jgi:RNA polymerase sigma-70 factor (ECF subfamily)